LCFSIDNPSPPFYTLSLHDALPISSRSPSFPRTGPALVPRRESECRRCLRHPRQSWDPGTVRTSRNLDWRYSRLRKRALPPGERSEEHTSELQSRSDLVCRLLLEKK